MGDLLLSVELSLVICDKKYETYIRLILGYSTGSIIKELTLRREYVEEFYSKRPQHQERNHRVENFGLQAKRAVSLPDMLKDEAPDNNYTIGAAREIWKKQSREKQSDNFTLL